MRYTLGVCCLVALLTGWCVSGTTLAEPEKELTIKEIMGKAHKGPNSILANIAEDLRDVNGPDWDEITDGARELVRLGGALGKSTPPKGEKDSWTKLARSYVENAKALQSAAEKHNKSAAESAQKKLQNSCAGCHKVHRKN
jgi:cytochrome c556